jgi:hypothetical protein
MVYRRKMRKCTMKKAWMVSAMRSVTVSQRPSPAVSAELRRASDQVRFEFRVEGLLNVTARLRFCQLEAR